MQHWQHATPTQQLLPTEHTGLALPHTRHVRPRLPASVARTHPVCLLPPSPQLANTPTYQARDAREALESRVAALEAIVAANMAAAAPAGSESVVAAVVEDTPLDTNGS
jgi:hypothetical protein